MAPPAWLPPLNSHENSITDVIICENQTVDVNDNGFQRKFYVGIYVHVSYYSEDDVEMKMEFPGLSVGVMKPVNVKNRETLINSLRDIIVDDEEVIPFQIGDFFYTEYRLNGGSCPWFYFSGPNKLVEKVFDFVRRVDRKPENAGPKLVSVNVDIRKSVMVPDEEFASWVNWYDEQKRVHSDFEEEYWRAISVPRDRDDVLEETMSLMARRSANSEIVKGLESVVVNGDGGVLEKSCSICLEEFQRKVRGTRLPCRHVFHENCIARWLAGNHVCPLCRHPLPVDE